MRPCLLQTDLKYGLPFRRSFVMVLYWASYEDSELGGHTKGPQDLHWNYGLRWPGYCLA